VTSPTTNKEPLKKDSPEIKEPKKNPAKNLEKFTLYFI